MVCPMCCEKAQSRKSHLVYKRKPAPPVGGRAGGNPWFPRSRVLRTGQCGGSTQRRTHRCCGTSSWRSIVPARGSGACRTSFRRRCHRPSSDRPEPATPSRRSTSGFGSWLDRSGRWATQAPRQRWKASRPQQRPEQQTSSSLFSWFKTERNAYCH